MKARNPKAQDATLINVNPLKRRMSQLERHYALLEERIAVLESLVEAATRGGVAEPAPRNKPRRRR